MGRITLLVLVLAASPLVAEELSAEKAAFKATAVPDRVLLGWKGDPARSASVAWRTDDSVGEPVAEIAEAGPGPKFEKTAREVKGTTVRLETNLGVACHHSVTFDGLRPDTVYAYRVGDDETWSEWFQFRTLRDGPGPVQFVYVGDAQNDIKRLWSRVIRQAYADAPQARFLLHAGDLVGTGDADHEWGQWFYSLGWMSGTIPQIAVPGNHEYGTLKKAKEGEPKPTKRLTDHWRAQFELPENGPMGLEEQAYYFDVQGVRVIALNSNSDQEMQAEWLESVLKSNPNRWTVVTHHHPIYSTGKDRDNASLRRIWQPIYDRGGVDLVLQGHDHSYGRTGPLRTAPKDLEAIATKAAGEKAVEANVATGVRGRAPGGAVYVVSVSGPKMYDLKAYPPEEAPFQRMAADTQLFQIITIDGEELRYEARTATGSLYDAFTLKKREGQPNEFVEQVPAGVEERLGEVKD